MKCWYTTSRHGILDNSYQTPAEFKSTCRVVNYKGTLFLFYIGSEGDEHDDVCFTIKPSAAGWRNSGDVGAESYSGPPVGFVFKDKLYVLCSGKHPVRELRVSPRIAEYDDLSGRFFVSEFAIPFAGVPSLVELNGRLYMFYKESDGSSVWWRSTTDIATWSQPQTVKVDGVTTLTMERDLVAINYQGLIHLVASLDGTEGTVLIKFDGDSTWSRARVLIDTPATSTPGLVVHNGLLRIVFSGLIKDKNDRALHQYCYDGNSLSAPEVSLNLGAKFDVSMAVQDGLLYVMYHGNN